MSNNNGASHRRHCMVVHNYYPQREPRVEREAQALVAHGYEVDVICLREDGDPPLAVVDGVNVHRLPVKRHKGSGAAVQMLEYLAFFAVASAKLAALHRRRRYNVVQVHNLPDFLVFAAWLPKLSRARLILDIHDLMPEFYASRFNSGMGSLPVRLVRAQEYLSCRFADHVISVTDLWRSALIDRGLPAEKVSVVMNVANDSIFRQPAAAPRADEPDRFRLFYHGTITRRYGIDVAIRAVEIVRRHIPGVHLTIHGVGEYRDELIRLVEELSLGQHVRFTSDYIPTSELPSFIRQADLGLVPYRRDVFTDGILPTKLMEYVALGVPVVAARTPVIESYFDETMVQFFTPEDHQDLARSILALHADRARLNMLARNADRFNQRYSWQRVSAEYLALVDRLHSR
jgi:glycosyltransferase involved in cell wall biosynthesis